ncbi:hypothetical protein T265_10368 [Opisthorchis viverrini]|uniref:Uncharacterized protein n=1 Tax=Opisthorchis viverrini TaxID=6198 RepID=A0A074Z2I2_OPIVI|nr:hypothetical protein T265_10368 [Opisthorchis viverrini]KER21266.1 hypothetical protein T265_10368 [Opisthorchis viverrini]
MSAFAYHRQFGVEAQHKADGNSVRVTDNQAEIAHWLRREHIHWKVSGSNPTSASRLLLSSPGQRDKFPVSTLASNGTAAGHHSRASVALTDQLTRIARL